MCIIKSFANISRPLHGKYDVGSAHGKDLWAWCARPYGLLIDEQRTALT